MEYVQKSPKIEDVALRGLLSYVSEQPHVCVKVIDFSGRIIAVSSMGIRLLQTDLDKIIGSVWTDFWIGHSYVSAPAVVDKAFRGQLDSFTGHYHGTAEPTCWRVEAMPLKRVGETIETIVVISPLLSAEDASESLAGQESSMRKVLHNMRNVAAVSQSASRLLQRDLPKETILEIAKSLADAGQAANAALSNFEEVMSLSDGPQSKPH